MTTKDFVVLIIWVIAAVLLVLVAIGLLDEVEKDFHVVAAGLAAYVIGHIINVFWKTA